MKTPAQWAQTVQEKMQSAGPDFQQWKLLDEFDCACCWTAIVRRNSSICENCISEGFEAACSTFADLH